jgi:23S rRNA pseudouridine955/2504/2580 synthase
MTDKKPESEAEVYSKVVFETVSEHEQGQRLDNFLLKRLKGVPKSKIYQIIRKGEVRIDKKRAKPSSKLSEGQIVRIPPIRQAQKDHELIASQVKLQKNQNQILAIEDALLYEDRHILVLNKPSGLAVHGGSGISLGLIELLRASRPKEEFLELVHRLDRETSGCIVIAKRGAILRELHQLIRESKIDKHYSALLKGRWKGTRHIIEAPLQKNNLKSGERVVRVSREGKESKTIFTIKEHFKDCTLVDAELLTGRTHQIRVHSQFSGHPILGDEKYGNSDANDKSRTFGLKRMFLHAHSLKLPLSCYDKPLLVSAPLDENLHGCLENLKNQFSA